MVLLLRAGGVVIEDDLTASAWFLIASSSLDGRFQEAREALGHLRVGERSSRAHKGVLERRDALILVFEDQDCRASCRIDNLPISL